VLRQLGLEQMGDFPIGTIESGGINLPMQKKVTIATELVADPPLLFLVGISHIFIFFKNSHLYL
jgi:ABC-type multidrug transport system ATPase subunit